MTAAVYDFKAIAAAKPHERSAAASSVNPRPSQPAHPALTSFVDIFHTDAFTDAEFARLFNLRMRQRQRVVKL